MVFMENCLASIFKWLVAWKRDFPRPNVSYECLSRLPTLSYTITKKKKRVFCDAKVIEDPEAPEGPFGVLFRFHSERVLFKVLSNRFFLWVICAFFPACRYFLSKSATTLFIESKCSVLHHIFKKKTSHFPITGEKNKEILAWYKREILYWKYMSSSPWFINYLYCWIYSSHMLH